jgi:H+/gluconate symporter-like permease
MSGFTETETLKTWTVTLAAAGVVGLVQILIVSALLPLRALP